jgi:UDP-3-O-[3-hydroxymyristoyl] glucosamine N-acyltransferase
MEFSLTDLAQYLQATLEGPAEKRVSTLAKIEEAGSNAIAFLANPLYEPYLYTTLAGAVLVKKDFVAQKPFLTTLIRVEDPYSAFTRLLELADKMVNASKVGREEPSYLSPGIELPQQGYIGAFAYVGKGVTLGKGVKIYPHVYIGDGATIGEDSILYSGAKIYAGVQIGARCLIHSGAVIGSDGFGHAPQADGSYRKIPQLGIVVLEDDVEVGANTVIDRATMGQTVLKRGVKLDNLIQIAHNVIVGEDTVMAAQVGISGSTHIGARSMFGGQAGVAGHLKLPDDFKVGAQAGIGGTYPEDVKAVMGTPGFEVKAFYKSSAIFRRLPEMDKRITQLEKKINPPT